ncbi:hypothetical protein OJF2_62030 [Aquisphaera giovannonii]|uniref:Uncharacterized protein n=1 Tax=Aquisphaera giovannonii TaxID=406548 RepID=A0A5B9WAQ2_9BACT|nr:hypothetical protein [Aquisphaera giovannonii]QEH37612.1 hypothetical protein OJF2_62030 [Aquisphaera giovannonii]
MSELDPSKIDLGELRNFAAASGASRRSVIVELGGQLLKVSARRPSGVLPRKGEADAAVLRAGAGQGPGRSEDMDRLQEALGSLGLGREAVRLDAAEAFVVTVTPGQLREITRLPLVGVVRPNRTHRASRKRTGS